MFKKCITLNGEIIHVGNWGYPDGAEVTEEQNLPLPEGANEEEIEVTYTSNGKVVRLSDYRELRKAEYPLLADQIDAIWKGGTAFTDMQQKIMDIKAKYPKPG